MNDELHQRLFDIITYLVTAAPTSFDETPTLSAFRMVDGADRLIELVNDGAADGRDQFLHQSHLDYQVHRDLVMTDQDAFRRWLTDYVTTFTEEALHRSRTATGRDGRS